MAYILDNASEGELGRLKALEHVYDRATRRCLDGTGVGPGWKCLEVGAGAGSVARWLCERVGPTGSVVATDIDPRFLEHERPEILEARRHNIINDDVEEGSYDLVHARALLEHLPQRRDVLAKLSRALKPGGWLVVEDADWTLLSASSPDQLVVTPASAGPLVAKVIDAYVTLLGRVGYDATYGRRLPQQMVEIGLTDVDAEMSSVWMRGGTIRAQFYRTSCEALRAGLAATRLTAAELDEWLALLEQKDTSIMQLPMVSVWGRRPQH